MMAPDADEFHAILQSALNALKRGDKVAAQSLAEQAVALAPDSEEAWLLLAALAGPGKSLAYIKKALQLNPESKPAQQALEWALKKQRDRSTAPRPERTDLTARLAFPTERLPVPDPHLRPVHPAIPDEALPEPEPPSEPVPTQTAPAVPAERLPQPELPSEQIHPPADPADVSPGAARSSPQDTGRKKFSLSPTLIVLLSLLGVGILISAAILLFIGRPLLGRLSQVAQSLQPATPFPTLFVPTPDCGPPTLVIGPATFQIQTLAPAPDGSLLVPAGVPGTAYWVQGTDNNYAFVLSPTQENLSLLSTSTAGSTAKITWSNCNSTTYSLSAPEPGTLNASTLPDRSLPGIIIFVSSDASGNGFALRGEPAEEQINTFSTPDTSGTEVQAEIGLLETAVSPDGSALKLTVSIYNFGGTPFTLSSGDVSLTPPSAAPLALTVSDPSLPREIRAAETKTFTLTFPRPSTPTATLRIFTVEYDIEGY